MSTEVTKTETTDIISQKRTAWSNMGEAIYTTEIALNDKSTKAINSIVLPKTIEEVAKAEAAIRELTTIKNELIAERKTITTRFDAVGSRLMDPEKNLDAAIKSLSASIIPIKSEYEKQERIKKQKEQERKDVKERVLSFMNNKDFEFKSFIADRVAYALKYALEEGNILPEKIEEYVNACSLKYTEKNFILPFPGFSSTILASEEVNEIIQANFKMDGDFYISLYREELKKKFVDYSVAYNNKAQAIALATKEESDKQEALKQEADNKTTSLKIEASSEVLDVTVSNTAIRALKKSYEVDMLETVESVLIIMSAFAANIKLCLPKLKVNKWFAFTPQQAATALAKVKCDDNNFAPSGVTFKEVEKL